MEHRKEAEKTMKRAVLTGIVAAGLSMGLSFAAFAGAWKQDARGWWYQNQDGSWPASEWVFIDGERYWFDADGYMAENELVGGTFVDLSGKAIPAAYGNIIRQYIEGSRLEEPHEFFEAHGMNAEMAGPEQFANCGYWLTDLAGDGTEELLVGEDRYLGDGVSWNAIYAGYTLADGKAVQFLKGWSRNRYSLCEGNYLKNEASGGAGYFTVTFWRLENGALTFVEGTEYDWVREGNAEKDPWHYGTTTDENGEEAFPYAVTADEAARVEEKYTVVPVHYHKFNEIMGI